MIHLGSVLLRELPPSQADSFPFSVPSIASLAGAELAFTTDVTFLVGENGSGKSTFLESLAAAARSITVGSSQAADDPSLAAAHALAREMKLRWTRKTRRGFFLRSEDFFGYARRMQQMRSELEADLRAIQHDSAMSAKARALASQPYAREIHDLKRRYGDGLDNVSHGESFLTLFRSRFVPDGLYLLDEPEAPLSPKRQLGFLSLLRQTVAEQNAQFIIATHSPILMALPGATILSFDGGAIRSVDYRDTEHLTITRDFLNHPEAFLQHL